MLMHFGVKPYIVFDGDYLPSKAHTEKERAGRRKESKKLGLELLGMGRISQAHLELQKAIDVTPTMARELIEELKRLDVPYVVAPYEADSQLAYLEKQGIISGVLSEDSDLLVFGVKCLLTKLDQYGECVMVNRADFTACREISLVGWTDKEFRIMAMLSGCDYLPGIDKMGLKTAYRLVRKHKVVDRIARTVQFDGKMKVPVGYLDAFTRAERTFLYQWVFCPAARSLVNLNKVPAELELDSMPYIGHHVDAVVAVGVAVGDLDPNTKQGLVVTSGPYYPASRTRPTQTPDEKQGKPISEFFKPRRTPLAELDPNSFTPSPSQQQLLQNQQGASWSASQVQTVRTTALERVASTNAPSYAPQATRRAASNQWPEARKASPKRQRLCSDSMLAASMDGAVGLQNATSRFFSKHPAQPSPSLRKPSRKADDFELWSDDSAAEAVAAKTATPEATTLTKTPSPKKRKKLQIYADPEPVEDLNAASTDPSQETICTTATAFSQNAVEDETPLISFEVEETRAGRTVFSKGIDAGFAALKSKFAFQSTPPRKNVSRTKSAPLAARSPLREAERNELLGRLAMTAPSPEKPTGKHHQMLDCPTRVTEENADKIPASSPLARPETDYEEAGGEHVIEDEEWLSMEREEASAGANLAIHGSEDLLVPNSPDSAGEDGRRRPQLNLGHFAFVA